MRVDELRIGYTCIPAAVTPPVPVSLAAQNSGNNTVISWPTNAPGWMLCETTNLTGAAWTTEAPIVVLGTNNTFTVSNLMGQQFFELMK